MFNGKDKLSFTFSKVKKRPGSSFKKEETTGKDFITGIEGKKLKLVKDDERQKEVLVIPVKENSTKKIADYVAKQKFTNKIESCTENVEISNDKLTLEQLAIKELLKEPNEIVNSKDSLANIPLSNLSEGEKESTLDDYENVPIEEYGMAMLRGMGWSVGSGIGKQGKVTQLIVPTLRPKGMGLGVNPHDISKFVQKDLQLVKGSQVKVMFGPNKDKCGKVEGFCDSSGRVIVKLTDNQVMVTVDEFNLCAVKK